MLYYCSRTCMSIVCPPFFGSLYWGMLIYFLSWNLLDAAHSYLTCCGGCICCFRFSRFGHSCLRQWLICCISGCYALMRITHRSVSSLTLVGLLQEMIVALGLQLKVAAIILGCIFSMLFSVFNALGPISNPTPPTPALTEFFHADTVTSDHPLLVSWYLISSVCMYVIYSLHNIKAIKTVTFKILKT